MRWRSVATTTRTRESRAAYSPTMAAVPSLDPLSTTTTSQLPAHSCASRASSWSRIVADALYAGMTTLSSIAPSAAAAPASGTGGHTRDGTAKGRDDAVGLD